MENNIGQTEGLLPNETKKTRYALLDELRGFLVLCMIFYHGFLSLYTLLGLEEADYLFEFFTPVQPIFAGMFILLSGMMCGFSHSNLLRGVKCFAVAVAVTIVTFLVSEFFGEITGDITIRFGILHLLGFSMMFCGVVDLAFKIIKKLISKEQDFEEINNNFKTKRILRKIGICLGLLITLALFFVFYGLADSNADFVGINDKIPNEWRTNEDLYPLGVVYPFLVSSADYFPILPWSFLFFAGYFLYKFKIPQKFSKIFEPKRIKPLGFLGRHALIIYIVHQPVIYLICAPFVFI